METISDAEDATCIRENELQNRADTPSIRSSECTFQENLRSWDLHDEAADEFDDAEKSTIFTKSLKLLKVIFYLSTFCIVLSCGVASKGALLFMTSAVTKGRTFPICSEKAGLEKDKNYEVQLSDKERQGWIWCLIFVLIIPELLIFVRSSRLCIFKKYQKPKISSFLMVFVAESLHVTGIIVMVFIVFPELHVMKALTLTSAFCFVPSLLNLYSNWTAEGSKGAWLKNFVDLVAFACQSSVFAWAYLNSNYADFIGAFSTLCISFGWWENFVNKNSPQYLARIKEDIEKSRHFTYIFISLWKVALIFGLSLICLLLKGENVKALITDFEESFKTQNVTVRWQEIRSFTIPDRVKPPDMIIISYLSSNVFLPVIVAGIQTATSYLCYSCGKFTCKICIQGFSFALPISLTVPVTVGVLSTACNAKQHSVCAFTAASPYLYWKCPKEDMNYFFTNEVGFFWVLWVISQIWITMHIWKPSCKKMSPTIELFVNPLYSTAALDQCLALNRRKDDMDDNVLGGDQGRRMEEASQHAVTRIFACATMWHETLDEMEQLLKSIMRLDVHQCSQKIIQDGLVVHNPDYYELEFHIFFDDAFVVSDADDDQLTINSFVKDFIVAVDTAASKIYKKCSKPDPPIKVPTPYGGRLVWLLRGGNFLVVHLKNKELIRHKKRWSQVMYMYYLLGYQLQNKLHLDTAENLRKNTFILALDGDIDFRPSSVQLLVYLMNRNTSLGAACGRIHPVGSGMMVYYQKFEYAIGHWLQKATEHMIGCVLCSPGCFSLFRAEALMMQNTIRTYATKSKEAIEYVQFDQGEDRWLCTLLLQRGYRVEYSAASDAYTHAPETFGEFYTQRRRWAPSTLANIMDLLVNYKKTVECNDNISRLYIAYQILLMVGTILGPGTIFLMLVGAMVSALGVSNWQSFIANLIPIVFFIMICFLAKNDTQIFVAQIFSALYALLMMAVLVGMSLQLVVDGITSPTAIFILSMTASFIISALAHPQEFWCVAHGLLYFLSVPSMYLLLSLYSFVNLHVVSWGTREVQVKKTRKQMEAERLRAVTIQQPKKENSMMDWFHAISPKGLTSGQHAEEEGSISFGLANLFRCMCCTYTKPDPSSIHMVKIEAHLEKINDRINMLQKQLDSSVNGIPGFRRRSIHGLKMDSNLKLVAENEDTGDDKESGEESDESEEHMYNQPNHNEYWLSDPALEKCIVKRLFDSENTFWRELIDTYLYPLIDDPQEKAKVSKQLLELRNKVVFGILMLNSLFILIVFLLQMQKDTLHIEWPLNGKANITYIAALNEIRIDMTYLHLEPINLVLVLFFTLILLIQFIGMLFHRLETLSHILASTDLIDTRLKDEQGINFSEITDVLQKQGLRDEDDDDGVDARLVEIEADEIQQRTCTQANGFLPFCDATVPAGDKIKERPKFRSLSIAMEQDLQKMLDKNPKFLHRVRRMSKNPAALEVLRRRVSVHRSYFTSQETSRASTPQASPMLDHIARLDREFSTPTGSLCHSFYNAAFDNSLDTESVRSIRVVNLPVDSPSTPIGNVMSVTADITSPSTSSLKRNALGKKEAITANA